MPCILIALTLLNVVAVVWAPVVAVTVLVCEMMALLVRS